MNNFPEKETLDDAHLRIGAAFAATVQLEEIRHGRSYARERVQRSSCQPSQPPASSFSQPPAPPLVLHANNDTIAAASATSSLAKRSKKRKRDREKAGPGDGYQYANPRVLVKLYARLRNGRTFAVRAVDNFRPGERRVSYGRCGLLLRLGLDAHTTHKTG